MKQPKTTKAKIETIYDNLYNAYCDYMYLKAISDNTNNNYILHSRTLSDYICFVNHIIEMTKRDFFNCIYKLIYDKPSFNFKKFKDMILEKFNYSLHELDISKLPSKSIKLLRNNYVSHSTTENICEKIILEELFEILIDMIQIYNEAVKFIGIGKQLSDINLQIIKESTICGVKQMFNNATHRKIYGDII